MNPWRSYWYLPAGAVVCAVLSVGSSDASYADAFAAAAAIVGGCFLLLALRQELDWPGLPMPVVDADPLLLLRNAFGQGRYGRETILARLDGLEGTGPLGAVAQRLPDRPKLLATSDAEFLDHVEARLDAIEART